MRRLAKRLIGRALRPALAPILNRQGQIDKRLERIERSMLNAETLTWRGGLKGHLIRPDGTRPPYPAPPAVASVARKYHGEIRYWVNVARGADPNFPGAYLARFAEWQRTRLRELGQQLGLTGDDALDAWTARRSVVEIGGGPFPAVAMGLWGRAVAVDPLADAYLSEGLVPGSGGAFSLLDGEDVTGGRGGAVVHLPAPGELIPLPSSSADLVIIENCLDHVGRPAAVLAEIARLLKPGGLLWLLVDLMDHRDELHPHPMTETRVRQLLQDTGLTARYAAAYGGHSHPKAHSQFRALMEKPAAGVSTVHGSGVIGAGGSKVEVGRTSAARSGAR